ncbi:hypothetical protein [Lutibacter sp.]|uniref:hypothetical protein n=1 Tax=Lutibacter sp. TaxID=1925666 RepID=UPI00356151AC
MITSSPTKQKISVILFAILLFFPPILYAQKASKNNKIYKIWVKPMDKSAVIKGYLYSVNGTSINLIDNLSLDTTNMITIDSKNIDLIKWRREGNVKRGLGKGAIGGALFGIIVGLTADLDPELDSSNPGDIITMGVARGAVTIGTTFTYGVIGGGIGTGIGSIKKKALIKGDVENYAKELPKLKEICIK